MKTGVRTGIVHIGVGNFHRSHQAMYVDRLADPDWGICGVGMLASDAVVRDGLMAQQGEYSLVLKHPDGTLERQVISSIKDYLLAPEDPWAVVDRLADPETRIVSLTITEGGYNVHDATGEFLRDTPAVVADVQENALPTTVFAVVVHALRRRRDAGQVPFTIVSCDNVEGNGTIAQGAFTAFAEMLDPSLAAWITDNVAFPNSMVDRITPATTDADRALVLSEWGVVDPVPVTAEPFTQWVLEDRFTDGRPALEEVGVQFVADVRPYELMKLRLLNASHQAMAYYGMLLGHVSVHAAAIDPDLVTLMRRYMDEEATPTLALLPDVDLPEYKAMLLTRFANPAIADTTARLGAFSSDRIPKFVLPVVRENAQPCPLSAGIVASWLHFTEARSAEVVDRRFTGQAPEEWLQDAEVFGDLVGSGFTDLVMTEVGRLRTNGPRASLQQYGRYA